MSSNVVVCTIDQELKDQVKKFRYSKEKEGAAIIMKVSSIEIYGNLLWGTSAGGGELNKLKLSN